MATRPDPAPVPADDPVVRSIVVEGVVQGVGFRPFVYRLARELALDGTVRNAAGRVEIEATGAPSVLDEFAARLASDAPPRARVERVDVQPLPEAASKARRGAGFVIEESVEDRKSVV